MAPRLFTRALSVLAFFALLTLAAQAQEAGRTTRRIVILGDSFSTSFGVPKEKAYPFLLQKKINAEGLGFYVVNSSQAKNATADGLQQLDFLMREPIDILVIAQGMRDGLRQVPIEDMRHNLLAMIYKVQEKYPRVQIVICGFELPPMLGLDYSAKFKELFPEVAKTTGIHLLPLLMEGVIDRMELRQPDELHPNADGHAVMAETMWKHLRPLMK